MQRVAAAALVVAVLAGACGEEGSGPVATASPSDGTYVAELVRTLNAGAYRTDDIEHFEDVLRAPSDPGREVSIVLGAVVKVEKGVARARPTDEDDPESSAQVDFDNPDAMVKSVHMTIDVTDVLAGAPTEATVRVGLSLPGNPDFARVESELLALDRVVLPIYRSPVYDYEDDLYGIRRDGSLLLVVDAAGDLSAPFFEADAGSLLRNTATLEQLEAQLALS